MNLKDVKKITIPEGSVSKITDSNGVVLWEEVSLYELYEGYYLTSHSYTYNTNYIDLGIKWNNNWKLEGKFYKPTTTSQWGRLLGTGYDTSSELYVNYSAETNGDFVINYGNTYISQLSNVYQTNVEYNFAFGNRGTECRCFFLKPGGSWTSFGNAWTPSNTNSTHNLRLFSNEQGDRDGIFGIGKIQINGPSDLWSESGALMLLVPARRRSDDVLGMYDKNNDVFYPVTTSGSGYFTITDVNGNVIYQGKQLTSITLTGQTTSLNRGSAFSFGGTVTANYSDGSTADVTSSTTFSGYNMSIGGTYTVTASYTENGVTVTATYTLTVNKAWSTIWSGSKTVKTTGSTTTGTASNFAQSIAGEGTSPQIRVTFSMSNSGQSGMTYSYYKNSTTLTTSKPSSPQTFNVNSTRLIGERSTKGYVWKEVYLGRTLDNTNKLVKFNLSAYDSGSSTVYGDTIQLTVTKIEQYY